MITPSFAITATERVLPKLALDFTTASLDNRITFTRSGNTATVTNSSGVIAAINADLPRFDYDPTTLICKGLLIEEARTNVLLNSLINGTNLSTQLVTTTAVAYTLSFYGTGQIVLSGTSTATVVGTGAYPSRKTLTFTPTAGVLTLTVTGTVQYAQLEVGSFATSFIPTGATTVTRNADVATMTGTNFSSWYNATQGAFYAEADSAAFANFPFMVSVNGGSAVNIMSLMYGSTGKARVEAAVSSVAWTVMNTAESTTANVAAKSVFAYIAGSQAVAINGGTIATATNATIPTVSQANLGGAFNQGDMLNGHLRKVMYWPQRLINAEVQAFSK